jgi:hypothetical protein
MRRPLRDAGTPVLLAFSNIRRAGYRIFVSEESVTYGECSFQCSGDAEQVTVTGTRPVYAPHQLAFGVLGVASVGLVYLVSDTRVWRIIGYALSSLLAITLVATFRRLNIKGRWSGYYSSKATMPRLIALAAAAAVIPSGNFSLQFDERALRPRTCSGPRFWLEAQ